MSADWYSRIKERLKNFLAEFKEVLHQYGKNPSQIKIVYATKYLGPRQFVSFLDIAKDIDIVPLIIGENRVQEAEEKIQRLKDTKRELVRSFQPVLIGTLQKNKINKAIKLFDEIHSVDSLELASALNMRLEREDRVMPVFLEVNVSGEKSKHGFPPEEIDVIIKELKLLKSLKIKGLMTMAPYTNNLEEVRGVFRRLKEMADRYGLFSSMGMSNDWKVAVEEGTDIVRIGARLFAS